MDSYPDKLDFNACFEHTLVGGSTDISADPWKEESVFPCSGELERPCPLVAQF